MADISTWSPVDESNTAAPPAGWPENMQPSAVNNSARGMMGAIRRWYDTVTAQLANFLPLTGGTISGNLGVAGTLTAGSVHTTNATLDGVLFVQGGTGIAAGSGAQTNIGKTGTGAPNYTGAFQSAGHILRLGDNTGMVLDIGGQGGSGCWLDVTNFGDLSIHYTLQLNPGGGNVTTGGALTANGNIITNGSLTTNLDVTANRNLATAGTCTAAQVTSTGNINAAGTVTGTSFIGNVTVPASGPISTGGTVTGGTVTSTGNITAAGSITASGPVSALGYQTRAGTAGATTANYFNIEWRPGAHLWIDNAHQGSFVLDTGSGISTSTVSATAINASSQVTSTGGFTTTDANGGNSFVIYSPPGANASFIQFLVGWYLHFNAVGGALSWFADSNLFWMMRYADHTCLNNLGPVAGLGAYINLSDRRGKTDIVPTTKGLAEVLRLSPVEFSRTSAPDRRELGFVAQDVEDVLPEAVRRVGITLPDGTGGLEDPEPSLGLTDSTIVAALVNAVKELNARIVTLEGAG